MYIVGYTRLEQQLLNLPCRRWGLRRESEWTDGKALRRSYRKSGRREVVGPQEIVLLLGALHEIIESQIANCTESLLPIEPVDRGRLDLLLLETLSELSEGQLLLLWQLSQWNLGLKYRGRYCAGYLQRKARL